MGTLLAGVSVTDITPPLGVELSGYGYYLERRCDGVRDPLYSKALVVDDGKERVAIVANDLIGLDQETVRTIRKQVEEETGIPPDHVLLACSHTHSGPATIYLRGCGEVDAEYVRMLTRKMAGGVVDACGKMERVSISIGRGREEKMSFNRMVQRGTVDPEVGLLRIDRTQGPPMAFVANFSAHAVTFRGDNTKVSRDYPGATADVIERVFLGSSLLFLQGSCGDVNPSNAFIGRPDQAGMILAGALLKITASIRKMEEPCLSAGSRMIRLPLVIPEEETVRRELDENRVKLKQGGLSLTEERQSRFLAEAAESTLRRMADHPEEYLETEIQAIRIGEALLMVHPSELFTTFGLQIKEGSPAQDTFVVGYANDFVGYIPDEGDFDRRGYAADRVPKICDNFPFTRNVGDVLVAESLKLAKEVMGS